MRENIVRVRYIYTKFCSGNLKGTDHLEKLGGGDRIILKWILKTWDRRVSIRIIHLRIGNSDRLLLRALWISGPIKRGEVMGDN
jgi:hypothetical protein